jgi:hypothetical protein
MKPVIAVKRGRCLRRRHERDRSDRWRNVRLQARVVAGAYRGIVPRRAVVIAAVVAALCLAGLPAHHLGHARRMEQGKRQQQRARDGHPPSLAQEREFPAVGVGSVARRGVGG